MLPDSRALEAVIGFLNQHKVPYMVIGGLANAVWGRARATHDADFKISIDLPVAEFRREVFNHFSERTIKIPKNLLSSHIIHIWAFPKVPVDLLVSVFDYEKQAIGRAMEMTIEGVSTRVCTAEDLIIHKAIADRATDWMDIEGVLMRQRDKLNYSYIRNWLQQFAEALENPDILSRFDKLCDNS